MILGHHTVSEFGLHISLAINNPYCYASKFFAFRHHKTPGILSVDHCAWSFYRNGNKGRSPAVRQLWIHIRYPLKHTVVFT